MSIIPGIEIAAPERTETSSGLEGLPKLVPVACSSRPTCSSISSSRPGGSSPAAMYARHASVVIVNPAGTGTPR